MDRPVYIQASLAALALPVIARAWEGERQMGDGTGAQLAGENLGNRRHVCALFDSADDAYRILLPFVRDGARRGERTVHLINAADRRAHVQRYRAGGMPEGTSSPAWEVRTWEDSYPDLERFNSGAMLGLVRRLLAEGRRLGFPSTRLVLDMGWVRSTVPGADELVRYEARLDQLLRRGTDMVVCCYDQGRNSRGRIAQLLSVHSAAIIDGQLRVTSSPRGSSARERILDAASELFSEAGVRAVGVDTLVDVAAVAKATFYRHFPSKDDLVVAWLRDPRARWFDRVRKRAEQMASTSEELIPTFFEAVAEWLEAGDFRGCPYLNTPIELSDASHPARAVIRGYLQEIEDYLCEMLAAAGYHDAELMAAELQALLAGAISLGVARRSGASAMVARDAATRLLASVERDRVEKPA
jgi:AcrR family transcriptional regulator